MAPEYSATNDDDLKAASCFFNQQFEASACARVSALTVAQELFPTISPVVRDLLLLLGYGNLAIVVLSKAASRITGNALQ